MSKARTYVSAHSTRPAIDYTSKAPDQQLAPLPALGSSYVYAERFSSKVVAIGCHVLVVYSRVQYRRVIFVETRVPEGSQERQVQIS